VNEGARKGLGVAAVGAAIALLAVVAPEIFTGTFSDAGTALRVLGLLVVLALWVVVMRRLVRHRRRAAVAAWLPVAVVLATLLWPYLRPARTADEAFPVVAALQSSTDTQAPDPPSASAPEVARSDSAESDPAGTPTTVAAAPSSTAPASTPPAQTPAPTLPPTTTVAEPVLLARGGFQGLTGHRGSGTASLWDLPDGSRLLRFEQVDIGSGPKLVVYLVPGSDRRDLGDSIQIAPLTAERGNQNYSVDPALTLEGEWTVLVWCGTFAVEVANATLNL